MSHHTANYGADVLAAAADGFFGQRQPTTKTDVKEDRRALSAPGSTRHLSRRGETRTGDAALQAVRRTHGDAVVAAECRLCRTRPGQSLSPRPRRPRVHHHGPGRVSSRSHSTTAAGFGSSDRRRLRRAAAPPPPARLPPVTNPS